MVRFFRLTFPAPLFVTVLSRQSCTYMYRVMTFLGWVPPDHGIQRYLYLSYSALVIFFIFFCLPTGLGISLFVDFKNYTPGEFLRILQMFINMTGTEIKGFMVVFYLDRLHQCRQALDTQDEHVRGDRDRRKVHQAVARSNLIFLVYAMAYLSYLVSDVIAGISNGQPAWLIYNPLFDWRNGLGYLLLQSLLEFVFMGMMTCGVLLQDTYSVVFVNILRAHIDVLKDHICELRTDPLKTETENYEELVDCIKYHKSVLYCCNLLRPIMSATILIQFLVIGIVLGLTMINILYFSNFSRGLASVMFLSAVLVQTFPFCYQCDLLAVETSTLGNFVAQCNWVTAEVKYKTTLKIFLHHVQQPIAFRAGALIPISLQSNIKMAKFAFSVMTIVRQMDLDERFS